MFHLPPEELWKGYVDPPIGTMAVQGHLGAEWVHPCAF